MAWGLVEAGEPHRVGDLVEELIPPDVEDYAALAGNCLQLAVLAALGDADRVQVLVDRLMPNAEDVVVYGSLDHLGVVDEFLALGLSRLGRHEEALTHARRAVARLSGLGMQPALHRCSELLTQLESGEVAGG